MLKTSTRLFFATTLSVLVAAGAGAGQAANKSATPSIQEMVGQLILARMHGAVPSSSFLARIRAGEIGGVVLYNTNFGPKGPAQLIRDLQAAARAAGQPPLLIGIDQEGGIVKRLPGAPSLAPPQMASATIAEAQGLATGRSLTSYGVNLDFAPVLDVAHGGFISPRTLGSTARQVATRGPAFAAGLARAHVLATAKHFPGLGYADLNTDNSIATVTASAAAIEQDWLPFKVAISRHIPIMMMSTAVYPALGSRRPAALSAPIVRDLRSLGFKGAIVTDALRTPAVNGFMPTGAAAVAAVNAGDDLVLAAGATDSYADTDAASAGAFTALIEAAQDGRTTVSKLAAAYRVVRALKANLV